MSDAQVARRIRVAKLNPIACPSYWDRDCRICMAGDNQLWDRRNDWKPGETVYVWGRTAEEFHGWHTDTDLATYDASIDRLSPEVKERMGIA
jgi:hypothetical protein